jgi:serine/threonine protein phosphatase 1
MKTLVDPFVVLPDTHGHLKEVERLVKVIRKCGLLQDHVLLFLGDYLDRGDHVKELIDYCIGMKNDGHLFLCGNHEYTLRQVLSTSGDLQEYWWKRWHRGYEDRTLKSYGLKEAVGELLWCFKEKESEELLRVLFPEQHIKFFFDLPLYYEAFGSLFVHAGLANDEPWEIQMQQLSQLKISHVNDWDGPKQLFSSKLAKELVNTVIEKRVVTGHAITPNPIITVDRALIHCGVEIGGPLVAFISDTSQIISVG